MLTASDIIRVNLRLTGKFWEPPTPEHPTGRWLVAQRVSQENANHRAPDGTFLSVYAWFIPYNPQTPRQQLNRQRIVNAMNLLRANVGPDELTLQRIMRAKKLPRWHAHMHWLMKQSGLV
jgi:hypothetical protein